MNLGQRYVTFVSALILNVLLFPVCHIQASSLEPSTSVEAWQRSIAILKVAKQKDDPLAPWQKKGLKYESHLASVVAYKGQKLVLTTAFAVENASSINLQPFSQEKKYNMGIVFADYEANLAILKPDDARVLKNMVPLAIDEEFRLGTKVAILTDQKGLRLELHDAKLTRIESHSPSTSTYRLLHYVLTSQKKHLGWSEPIVYNKKLVGLASGQSSRHVFAIPAKTINHFLSESFETYRGFATLGVRTQSLRSPILREALGVGEEQDGVRVVEVSGNSAFLGKVKKNDILLAVNDHAIDAQGQILSSKWGRVPLEFHVNQLFAGSTSTIIVQRKMQRHKFSAELKRHQSSKNLLRHRAREGKYSHLIFSGLVFTELSDDYLATWGANWHQRAKSNLLFPYYYGHILQKKESRLVILSKVLADTSNHGYDEYKNEIVGSVNGHLISSMEDLYEAFKTPENKHGQAFATIDLALSQGKVILSYKNLEKTHKRIASVYGLSEHGSFFSVDK